MEGLGVYSPLPTRKSIRLLHLQRGSNEDSSMIKCFLTVHELDAAPSYEAISYVWGEPKPSVGIRLNDRPFDIGLNLAAALRQLRPLEHRSYNRFGIYAFNRQKKAKMWEALQSRYDFVQRVDLESRMTATSERILWVDALCIDQSNLEEKSLQVREMAHIYKNATQVLLWLGTGQDADTKDIINALPLIKLLREDFRITRTDAKAMIEISSMRADLEGYPKHESSEWDSFHRLFDREWFERLWVVQEVCLASSAFAIIGDIQLEWETIGDAVMWIHHRQIVSEIYEHGRDKRSDEDTQRATARMALAANIQVFKHFSSSLDILFSSPMFKCKLSIDRIYGILGILEDITIDPDYRKPFSEVFCSVTQQMIETRKDLVIFGLVHHDELSLCDPSWAPVWRTRQYYRPMNTRIDSEKYRASLDQSFQPTSVSDERCLAMRGIPICKIARTSKVLRPVDTPYVYQGLLLKNCMEFLTVHLPGEDNFVTTCYAPDKIDLIIFDLLTAGLWTLDDAVTTDQLAVRVGILRKWLDHAHEAVLETQNEIISYNVNPQSRIDKHILSTVVQYCFDRRLFSTNDGHLGFGPSAMKMGDEVVILFGGATPFVVRPLPDQDDQSAKHRRYHLIGECYVHGIMKGEAIEVWKKSGSESTTYELV